MRHPPPLAVAVLVVVSGCASPMTPAVQPAALASDERIYVLGYIEKPGRYPVVEGKTPFTLTKLVALCGNFRDMADRANVRVVRATPSGRESTTLNFDDIIEGRRPDFELKADDVVFVPERR
jgi:protein involved in polysaccharide export with SLBB domain